MNIDHVSIRNVIASHARVALLVAAAAVVTACSRSEAEPAAAPALPEVLTVQAQAADGTYDLVLPARALADESAHIYARATGFISERRVDLGDRVAAGQVLAVISAPEVDQAVSEARALLAKVEADATLARVNF